MHRVVTQPTACDANGRGQRAESRRHRGYAFQWYSLAVLIAALAGFFGWKAWRER